MTGVQTCALPIYGGSNGTAGLRIGGTSNYESLELGIYGSYGGMIRSYGNDLHYFSGHWKTIGATASENHAHYWYCSQSGSTNWSTAKMTLDAGGNLGLGTTIIKGYYGSSYVDTRGVFSYTSDSTNCDTATKGLVIRNDDTTASNLSQLVFGSLNTGSTPIATASIWSINDARSGGFSTGSLAFGTVGGSGVISERARITSGGFFKQSTEGTYQSSANYNEFYCNSSTVNMYATNGSTGDGILTNNGNNSTANYFYRGYSSGDRFYVYCNGNVVNTNNSYGTLSDIKLKENIVDATPKLADVMRLQVRNFNLKTDPAHKQIGFVAQEFEQVFPGIVESTPDRDAQGEDTGEVTKVIKTSVLVPILVKAIQELKAEVDSLKTQLEKRA